jgi:predicted phage terminase large subunit-like protein
MSAPTKIQKLLAGRELARRRLLHFTKVTHGSYDAGWVHEDICRRLEKFSKDVADGKSPRLMLLMPPRHGKSELASIRFPAWHFGSYPHHEIINVGYNTELPMKFSRKVREVMREGQYQGIFPNAALDPNSQSVEAWYTTAGGGFTAAGVGGGITGKGAHVLVIDDPIKNQEEADSVSVRDKLWDWYQSTAYTRLAPGGGVLVIECMTGDTPVRLPNGSERRLDELRAGDVIATYENGKLSSSRVANHRSSGNDHILRITTSSGKIVRANGRHPFLATTTTGELKWIRARSLSLANKIVTVKASGGNTQGSNAPQLIATNPPSAEVSALVTTVSGSGLVGTAPRLLTQSPSAQHTSSTDMGSQRTSTKPSLKNRMACAQSAEKLAKTPETQIGGTTSSPSTTATTPTKSEGCSATTVTLESDILELSPSHLPLHDTSDFTLDEIVSIEPDGVEEVFDISVERTTNFIANGVVSSNTWWNDDDLAGRLQDSMRRDPEADQFEIVKYPAISGQYEYRNDETNAIVCFTEDPNLLEGDDATKGLTLLRKPNECLHHGRYPLSALKRIKANLQPRIWSALFQQNPVPDEGMYFRKDYFREQQTFPQTFGLRIFTAWDFAIGEKQVNDWTVGATLLQDENDVLYVLDIHRFRGDSFQIVEAILDTTERYSSLAGVDYQVGAEDGMIWRSIEPLLKRRMGERRLFPVIEPLRPITDKAARARPLQGRMQQGRVVFPAEAHWKGTAVSEMLRFPAGAHDDVVDALAWAVRLSMMSEPPQQPQERRIPSWRDKLTAAGNAGSHMTA